MIIELPNCAVDFICKLFNGITKLGYFLKKNECHNDTEAWERPYISLIVQANKLIIVLVQVIKKMASHAHSTISNSTQYNPGT